MFVRNLQNIRFLALHGLPKRSDDDDADSNFLQLLQSQSVNFPEIKTWLMEKMNNYTSHEIQTNVCISCHSTSFDKEFMIFRMLPGCVSSKSVSVLFP